MELRRGEPGVTIAGVRTYLAIVGTVVAGLFLSSWMSTHDVRWAVATFDTIAWLAIATMGSRRLYPRLTDDDLAAIRTFQVGFLAFGASGLLMSLLPAARAAGRIDLEVLNYSAQAAIFVGLAMSFRPPLRQLPTPVHQLIVAAGICALPITLFSA